MFSFYNTWNEMIPDYCLFHEYTEHKLVTSGTIPAFITTVKGYEVV